MRTKPTKNGAASLPRGANYYFSSWSYEDRAFLRALYKKYPCTKVHLMVHIMESAPDADRWDCSHWRLWANMARQVRRSIRKQVAPKEMEAFFWDVIAEGTGQDEVTERLDALIFSDDASPAISAREMSSSAFEFVKSTATVEEWSEDTYEESDDDEVTSDDDKDADFTVGRSRSARVASRDSKRAPKRARSPKDQPRPAKLAPHSGSAKMGEAVAGSGLDVTFVQAPDSGNARIVELSAGPNFEVACLLESVLSEVCKMDAARQQAFGQDADGGAAELEEYDETGAHGQRISSCPAQPCAVGDGSGQALDRDRPTSVSDDASGAVVVTPPDSQLTRIPGEANHVDGDLPPPGVGDGGLVGVFRRSDFAGGDVCHDYAMPLPDVEVHIPETAISFDKEVQCNKPTCEDKAVQCEIYSPSFAEMMHKEHLLRMEVMLYHKDLLTKKFGPL